MSGQELIEGLLAEIGKIEHFTETQIAPLPVDKLLQRPSPKRWSILECLEHMNLSSGHYIKRLEKLIPELEKVAPTQEDYEFKPGFFGEKFSTGILPKKDGTLSNSMKTFFFFEPKLAKTKKHRSLEEFITMNQTTVELLERAKKIDLNKGKVTSTLGPIFRFKTGDAFRFAIGHNVRHMVQIERVLHEIQPSD